MDDLLQKIAPDRGPQDFQELFRLYGSLIKAMMMRQRDGRRRFGRQPRNRFSQSAEGSPLCRTKKGVVTWIYANLRIDRLRRQAPIRICPRR